MGDKIASLIYYEEPAVDWKKRKGLRKFPQTLIIRCLSESVQNFFDLINHLPTDPSSNNFDLMSLVHSCGSIADQNTIADQNAVADQNTVTDQHAVADENAHAVTDQHTIADQHAWSEQE